MEWKHIFSFLVASQLYCFLKISLSMEIRYGAVAVLPRGDYNCFTLNAFYYRFLFSFGSDPVLWCIRHTVAYAPQA